MGFLMLRSYFTLGSSCPAKSFCTSEKFDYHIYQAGQNEGNLLALRIKPYPNNQIKCNITQLNQVFSSGEKHETNQPLVKMCGIASARDDAMVTEAGANFIGMILWPKSKHSISVSVAKEISKVAREFRAKHIGVFVDDDLDTILRASDASNIEFVQIYVFFVQSLIHNNLLVA